MAVVVAVSRRNPSGGGGAVQLLHPSPISAVRHQQRPLCSIYLQQRMRDGRITALSSRFRPCLHQPQLAQAKLGHPCLP